MFIADKMTNLNRVYEQSKRNLTHALFLCKFINAFRHTPPLTPHEKKQQKTAKNISTLAISVDPDMTPYSVASD